MLANVQSLPFCVGLPGVLLLIPGNLHDGGKHLLRLSLLGRRDWCCWSVFEEDMANRSVFVCEISKLLLSPSLCPFPMQINDACTKVEILTLYLLRAPMPKAQHVLGASTNWTVYIYQTQIWHWCRIKLLMPAVRAKDKSERDVKQKEVLLKFLVCLRKRWMFQTLLNCCHVQHAFKK